MFQQLKNYYHLIEAIIANIRYGFPSRKIKVIGVTGTDGKTTTTHLIYHILKSADKKVSMVSTVYGKIGDKVYDTGLHTTTPDAFLVQKLLRLAVDHEDEYFVLETTSHALDQNRVWGVNYYIGVITNITHEHLDYHKTYNNYFNTKLKLILNSKYAVINQDDSSYSLIKNQKLNIKYQKYNSKFKNLDKLPELAEFNKYNYSASYQVAKILKIENSLILKAMLNFHLPPGRLDVVYDKEFKVIVDFAHTPNAFEAALSAIKKQEIINDGQLIHVFGAAGLRDTTKRSMMGEASSKYSDYIILTEEDYRTEDPSVICKQIASGIKKGKPFEVVVNRQKAIDKAVKLAKKNDVIIITGKGHEQSLCRETSEYPWDDAKAVMTALKILNPKS